MNEILPDFLKIKSTIDPNFKLPDGYFETFADHFFEKLTLTETDFLNDLAALKSASFQIPTDYFENLPNQVFEKIASSNVSNVASISPEKRAKTVDLPSKKPFFQLIWRPIAVAAAASVALFAVFSLFFQENSVGKSTTIACNTTCLSEKISDTDVHIYLSENLADFNDDELLSEALIGDLDSKSIKKSSEMQIQADDAQPILKEMLDEISIEDLEKML
jgi:hypothetical protein